MLTWGSSQIVQVGLLGNWNPLFYRNLIDERQLGVHDVGERLAFVVPQDMLVRRFQSVFFRGRRAENNLLERPRHEDGLLEVPLRELEALAYYCYAI
jgi:hypothetical protein